MKIIILSIMAIFIISCTPQLKAPWEEGEIFILSNGSTSVAGVSSVSDEINFDITTFSVVSKSNDFLSLDLVQAEAILYLKENTETSFSGFSMNAQNLNASFIDERTDPVTIYSLTIDGVYVSTSRSDVPPFTQHLDNVNTISGALSTSQIFIGSNSGLYMANTPTSLSAIHADISTQVINNILTNTETAPDQVLVSSSDGLYVSNDEGVNFSRHTDVDFENIVMTISSNSLTYLSGGTTGAYISTDTAASFVKIGSGTIAETNTIQALSLGPNNEIYIGTNEGLAYSLDGGTTFTELSTTNSNLIGNDIRDLETDSLGNLFVATENGLSILRPGESIFINENIDDGLPSNSINSISIIEDSLGNPSIYLGTDSGPAILNNPMPNTPTSFSASALTSNSARLTWVSGEGTTGGFSIAYKLGVSTPTDCSDPTATILDVGNVQSKDITGLTHLSNYVFKLCPYNGPKVVDNNKSLDASVILVEDIAPNAIFNLDNKTTSSIALSWSSTGGSTNGWRLSTSTSGAAPNDCSAGVDFGLGTTSTSLTGLPSNTDYSFRLCSVNTTGFFSSGVTIITKTDELAPPAPTLNTITSVTQNSALIDYTSGGGTTDNVKAIFLASTTAPVHCLDGSVSPGSSSGTINMSGLLSNTDYTFVTCAYNITDNTSTVSNSFTIKTGNFSPTDITLSSTSILENLASGTVFSTITETDADPNETYTFSLVAGTGDTDNTSFNISGNNLESAVIFDFETKNSYSIRVRVTDSNSNIFEEVQSISILNANDLPPVLQTPTASIVAIEGIPIASEDINDTSGGDTDIEGDQISYSCFYDSTVDGSVASVLSCSSIGIDLVNTTDLDGVISWTPSFTQNGPYEIKVIGDDGIFNDSQIFTINVSNANAPPHDISLTSYSIFENTAIGFNFASITASDVDPGDLSFTYAFVSGAGDTDNTSFNIVSGDSLENSVVFDAEVSGTRSIRLQATEPGGLTYEEAITIIIGQINDMTPTIGTIATQNVSEGILLSIDANTIQGGDLDIDGDALLWSCFYDTTIDGSVADTNACSLLGGSLLNNTSTDGILNWTPTFTQSDSYEFKFKAFDSIFTDDEIFTVNVSQGNAPPTDITLTSATVLENQVLNTGVGVLTATDVDLFDVGDLYTYAFVNGAGDTDNASFTINGDILETLASFDRETKSSYSIRVEAEDSGGKTFSKALTISVGNVNEAPILANLPTNDPEVLMEMGNFTVDIADSSGGDTDVDGDPLTYSCFYDLTHDSTVAEAANDCSGIGVQLNSSTGVFSWTPSFGDLNTYEFKIVGVDSSALRGDGIFRMSVTDPPVCGDAGNECYDHAASTAHGFAETPGGKVLEYYTNANGVQVWKEYGGSKVLKPNGTDNWQKMLAAAGTSYSVTDYTTYDNIEGRYCPDVVYIDDADKFNADACLYTDVISSGALPWGSWGAQRWFYGNLAACGAIGMRLPVAYEGKFYAGGGIYPLSNGVPTVPNPLNGVPAVLGGETWTATPMVLNTGRFIVIRGADQEWSNPPNSKRRVCVLP